MTPSNLTQQASIREFQKYFNQAFNLAAAAADQTFASTQTIAGGLIICRNFTVNAGVTLTISNPTTIICQTFTNNGTITMSPISENVLGLFRSSDAPRIPEYEPLNMTGSTLQISATAPSNVGSSQSFAGFGGASFGNGAVGGGAFGSPTAGSSWQEDGSYSGFKYRPTYGWKRLGMAFWWPIAQFRNPVLGQGAGLQFGKSYYSTSLAFQRKGTCAQSLAVAANSFVMNSPNTTTVGGNPGSFLEVFARVSITNAASGSITAIGQAGTGATNQPAGGGGGGGAVGFYSEGFISQLGTVNCSGGAGGSSGGTVNHYGGGGGGGGGIFLTAPTITNSGTNTIAGGAAGTGGFGNGLAGDSGVVVAEPYLRLWMPGEDDNISGARYAAT